MRKKPSDKEIKFKKHTQESLGNTLREIRKNKKLTQNEVGFRCDTDDASYNNIEAGRRNITVYTLHKIAHALNEPIENILKTVKKE